MLPKGVFPRGCFLSDAPGVLLEGPRQTGPGVTSWAPCRGSGQEPQRGSRDAEAGQGGVGPVAMWWDGVAGRALHAPSAPRRAAGCCRQQVCCPC